MAITIVGSNNTELKTRTLWYDGDSTISESEIVKMLTIGLPVDGMFVEKLTSDISRYNKLVPPDQRIGVKTEVRGLTFDWNIPSEYKQLDLIEYCNEALETYCSGMMEDERNVRFVRVARELSLYFQLGLQDVLRTLIFIINTLRANNIVWGVGRGSSVSSYVLYLIGVHDVDSVKYELDITDFLRIE